MVTYPLYEHQKNVVLSNQDVGKRVLGMTLQYAKSLRDEQVQLRSQPAPRDVRFQFLNLISLSISKTRQMLDLSKTYGTDLAQENINTLLQDIINSFRSMALYYSSIALEYLKTDYSFQSKAIFELGSLSTLLDEIIVIIRDLGLPYLNAFVRMKVLSDNMIALKDISIKDVNDIFRDYEKPVIETLQVPTRVVVEPEEKKQDEVSGDEVAQTRRVMVPVSVDRRSKASLKDAIIQLISPYENDPRYSNDVQRIKDKINVRRISVLELREAYDKIKRVLGYDQG